MLRRAVLLGVTLGSLIVLFGCSVLMENPASGAIAVSRDRDQLLVVVCTSFRAAEVRMSERAQTGDWSYFWKFARDIDLVAGDELSPSRAGELGVVPARVPKLEPHDDIRIVVANGADSVTAQFSVPDSGLSEEQWLHPNGEMSAIPCD